MGDAPAALPRGGPVRARGGRRRARPDPRRPRTAGGLRLVGARPHHEPPHPHDHPPRRGRGRRRAGARLVGSAAAAVLAVSLVAAPLVLSTTRLPLDEVGAPLLVTLVGLTQLLVARSYRHPAARVALRLAGLWCLGCVLVAVVAEQSWSGRLGLAAVVVGVAVVAAAVAMGRGWRSVWWGRRAEIAEALSVALAVPAFVVTVGVFRRIWEIVG
ncbi:hypothetical protein [Nocardioides zeae]